MMGLGLGLGLVKPVGLAATLLALARDPAVQIAGRDGSVSLADPGCTFLDPPTSQAISANRAYNLVGPGGLVLPMYTAFPEIVNLHASPTGANDGLTSNTLANLKRTLVEDSSNGVHLVNPAATVTLTDSAVYTIRVVVSRPTGTRHAGWYFGAGVNRAGFCVNMSTGTATALQNGTGTVSSLSSISMGSGRWLITCVFTSTAWGTAGAIYLRISDQDSTPLRSYIGDGVSSISYDAPTLIAGTLPPLGLAIAATRAADANVWTMADALTQDEEIIVLGEQDYASGDLAIASQTWLEGVTTVTNPAMVRSAATTLDCIAHNGTTTKTAQVTRTIPNRTITGMHRLRTTATGVAAAWNNGALSAETDIDGGTWTAQDKLRIGNSAAGGRDGMGRFACIRRKGGFSQAQIDALYYAFANGRTVPAVA
jgi:hypothetical protein